MIPAINALLELVAHHAHRLRCGDVDLLDLDALVLRVHASLVATRLLDVGAWWDSDPHESEGYVCSVGQPLLG